MDVEVVFSVSEDVAKRLMDDGVAEVALRDSKKRFEPFVKMLPKKVNPQKTDGGGNEALKKLQGAMQVINLAATIASTVIICGKLNMIDSQLDEMRKDTADLKDINFELQLANPCRELISNYKVLSDQLRRGKIVSSAELLTQIRKCRSYLVSLHQLCDKLPMEPVLELIFTLLPMYANYICVYYRQAYDDLQGKHVLHDEWMNVFTLLNSESFLNRIQDDMFTAQFKSNRDINEYLAYHTMIVDTLKQEIEQELEDIETCGGEAGYDAAMQWSRQYVAQQAKVKQSELESQFGPEKAREMINQALEFVMP